MKQKTIFRSRLLNGLDGVIHGYSSRQFGDMRNGDTRAAFAQAIGLDGSKVMKPQQVHGNEVSRVTLTDAIRVVPNVDGLVSNNLPLSVITADCAPLLAVDPVHRIVGVAHAGWKGTLNRIAANLIKTMHEMGSETQNIYVAIGPRIDMDNYDVPQERAQLFEKAFGKKSGVVKKVGDSWFMDIGMANMIVLQESGINQAHIDMLPYSTYSMSEKLYSYRKDNDSVYGEIVGVIGIQK